jgi:uncharacterized RDD family membrane protein YckC
MIGGTDEVAEETRARARHIAAAARAQAAAAALARQGTAARHAPVATEAERTGAYAGMVTRAVAYSLDLALVNLVALLVGVAVALVAWVLHRLPHELETALEVALACAYVLWLVGYFVAFWSTTGQTPGDRVMRIRVIDARAAGRIGPVRSVTRFIGVVLATIPLLAGFLMMLWDDRRRCLQDRIARTVVVHAPPQARIVRQSVPLEQP